MAPSQVKLDVQRTARRFEQAVAAADVGAARGHFSPEFATRDSELVPLLERTSGGELIGTVATRTLLHLRLADGDTSVIELLWREHGDGYLIEDCRVFSLIPGE